MRVRIAVALLVLVATAAAAAVLLIATYASVKPWPADPLPNMLNSHSVAIYDRHGSLLGQRLKPEFSKLEQLNLNLHRQLEYHELPEFFIQALVMAEDQRFWQHAGVDWRARLRALYLNLSHRRTVSGASTISEQVVRMLRPRQRTLWTRWIEGFEAQRLEQMVDKVSLLEFYINQVPYAANRRGLDQAAEYYFDRSVSSLTQKELLALAVFIRAPSYLHPKKALPQIESRIAILMRRMADQGQLSSAQLDRLENTGLELGTAPQSPRVKHLLDQALTRWDGRGDEINTFIDSNLQSFSQKLLEARIAELKPRNVNNGALLIIDHQAAEILAWVVAGDSWPDFPGAAYNAVLTPRQPGSTLKPFIYTMALERGYSAAYQFDDHPLNEAIGRGMHQYSNYSNRYYGLISMREALGNSLNIPAVLALQKVGAERVLDKLKQLGFANLDQQINTYGDGLALGNGEVSLLELAQAYCVLARNGQLRVNRLIASPFSERFMAKGSVEADTTIYNAAATSLIADILSDPAARQKEFGRSSVLNLPVQTAVKTGTSSNYRDAWVVGFNYRYTVAIWMGNMDFSPMQTITGSIGPAYVLRSVMKELNQHQATRALTLDKKLVKKTVCFASGEIQQAGQDCAGYHEYFIDGLTLIDNSKPPHANPRNIRISQPTQFLNLAVDPRIPAQEQRFRFRLAESDNVASVHWLLDGESLGNSTLGEWDWQLQRGEHRLQAKVTLLDGTAVETPIRHFFVH